MHSLLLGISMLGAAEAMLLGTKLGLKPDLLADIINTSTGKCWASEINNPMAGSLRTSTVPADRGYSGGCVCFDLVNRERADTGAQLSLQADGERCALSPSL